MPKYNSSECQDIQIQLSAYFDKQIPTWKRYMVQRHLKQCTECRSQLNTIEQTDKLLHYLEPVQSSDNFFLDVISGVTTMNASQKTHLSAIGRLSDGIEKIQDWVRGNIQTYTLTYIFALIFGVFTMIGVTLYSPTIEKYNPYNQYSSKSQNQQETLISFEVISEQKHPRRRFLKIR